MTNHSNKKLLTVACLCMTLFESGLQAQNAFQDAHSIVIEANTEILCKSMTQATEKNSRTITILNQKGMEAANFYCGCDMFNSLQKFSGEILNATGQSVRKIKKSELQKSEYSSHLSSDDYYYYYNCNYPSFPFTVKYEWETKCSNGLIGYRPFYPQSELNQGVMTANYRIEMPVGQKCRYRIVNNPGKEMQVNESTGPEGQQIIKATVANLTPTCYEPFGPSYSELIPCVYFAPSQFAYDKTTGDLSTWQKYGEWQYKLLDGRDVLTEPFRSKLHELTAHCRTDREKVKVIYDYLAKTTRYVSIQLGIGGLQPIPAADVCRTGFGDCKGLSNYTRAMLKEVGIPSTYTVISTTNPRLLSDFSSANQMNHVILQVPLPQDTLWLECTNPLLPFGYVHQDIAGHDALLIEPTGGRLCRLPVYPDSLNTQTISARIIVSPTAEAQIEVSETSRIHQYEDAAGIIYEEPAKQKDRIRGTINLSQADIVGLQITECKEAKPSITFNYTAKTHQFGQKTGNRLFIPLNIFRKGFNVPRVTKRAYPIDIDYGYMDTDSIRIQLPEGYSLEGRPRMADIKTKFGSLRSTMQLKDKDVLIVYQLFMSKGVYAPEEYADFIDFREQVARYYNGKIILKKD